MVLKGKFLTKKIRKVNCTYDGCGRELLTRSSNKQYCSKHSKIVTERNISIGSKRRRSVYMKKSIYNVVSKSKKFCLKCDKKFDSLSKYNKICPSCSNENSISKEGCKIHFDSFGINYNELVEH